MKFYVENKKTGEAIKKGVRDLATRKEIITAADIYELFGHIPDPETKKKGWSALHASKRMRLRETKNGWFLYLPEPAELKPVYLEDAPEPYEDSINLVIFEYNEFIETMKDVFKEVTKTNPIHYYYRPCTVLGRKTGPMSGRKDRKAWLHREYETDKGAKMILCLVEFEDGSMEEVVPSRVIFSDRGEK